MEIIEVGKETNATETASAPTSRKRKNPFATRKEDKERRQAKKARIIVRNLSYKTTEDTLKKHFEQWGTVVELNLLKRADGKLVGCAFVQYATVNQATKAILKGNNKEMLGRSIFIDWALGKNEYVNKTKDQKEPEEKKPKAEVKDENTVDEESGNDDKSVKEESDSEDEKEEEERASIKSEDTADNDEDDESNDSNNIDEEDEATNDDTDDEFNDDEDVDKKDLKSKLKLEEIKPVKHISNDVQEGCTVFIKNVPFDAEDTDLRKVCRKFGPIYYAIINRERVSAHSKGTAFVKFKTKESADLCLQAGTEFTLMEQVLDPHPALSRDEIRNQTTEQSKRVENKDSRNLYLAREGLIMSGSKAADGVSAADMARRHKLEQVKTQVLKNLNRFVSRNRLSIHNLPLNYDNEKLKQMAIAYTTFRPHECRVMRENKITPEHPKGISKGFGFLSFNTHQEALTALRKLNNNPKIFGTLHRPIVAFSIEDRAVHKIKEKRKEKSKVNNPTYQEKLEKRKQLRKEKAAGKAHKTAQMPQNDNKAQLKKHIQKLEATRAKTKANAQNPNTNTVEYEDYVGMAAKQGTTIRMRSNKKINEQAQEHLKRVKGEKRKEKQRKIKQMHLTERKAIERPKQGARKPLERDDLTQLVNKYKRMIDSNDGGPSALKTKKSKRTKWYQE